MSAYLRCDDSFKLFSKTDTVCSYIQPVKTTQKLSHVAVFRLFKPYVDVDFLNLNYTRINYSSAFNEINTMKDTFTYNKGQQ